MEKSNIQEFFLSTLNVYINNKNTELYNKVNDTINYDNNSESTYNYINNTSNNINNSLSSFYITKDNMLFLLIVIVLIYTFIQRERKMLSETNTFKQILNFTPTLIVLEINFAQKVVNTVNPVLTKSNSSNNLTQYFNNNNNNNVNNVNNNQNSFYNNNLKINNLNQNNNQNINNTQNINNNNNYTKLNVNSNSNINIINEQNEEVISEKYFTITSFCESLNIDSAEFINCLNNQEMQIQNSKGIVLKSIDGTKKYRFSGKCDKSIFRGLVLDISEEVSELKKLKYILAHDPLTGLPNRYRLDEKIQKFCNKSETDLCSLYFMDLNKFKSINDTYGHEVGDMVLKHVSNQFKSIKDNSVLPIRLSGDEFLIVKRNVENVDHADNFISQFTTKVSSSTFTVDGEINTNNNIPIFFSYGGVVFNKSETKVSSIIKTADEKMYQMKKGISNKNVIEFTNN